MSTGYRALSHSDSFCSLNSSESSGDHVLEKIKEEVHLPLSKKPSVYVFRCRYCKREFTSRQHGFDEHCMKAPNYARENVDKLCIVRAFHGCWYHISKDQVVDDTEINMLRREFPEDMSISLWIKYILLSCLCLPCLCLWLPFFLWERQTRTIFGPRHSIRRRRLGNYINNNGTKEGHVSQQITNNMISDHTTEKNEVRITIDESTEITSPKSEKQETENHSLSPVVSILTETPLKDPEISPLLSEDPPKHPSTSPSTPRSLPLAPEFSPGDSKILPPIPENITSTLSSYSEAPPTNPDSPQSAHNSSTPTQKHTTPTPSQENMPPKQENYQSAEGVPTSNSGEISDHEDAIEP